MHHAVKTVYDHQRGCGWRHPGNYLVADGFWAGCGKLPLPLTRPCVCCGNGLLATIPLKSGGFSYELPRNLRRINALALFSDVICKNDSAKCNLCLVNQKSAEVAYLIGVGEQHYPTKDSFLNEALVQGVSKRIGPIPKEFVVGKSPVFLAHPKGRMSNETTLGKNGKAEIRWEPAVIAVFVPTRIEYVVRGDESDEEIERLLARGITPVKVEHIGHEVINEKDISFLTT